MPPERRAPATDNGDMTCRHRLQAGLAWLLLPLTAWSCSSDSDDAGGGTTSGGTGGLLGGSGAGGSGAGLGSGSGGSGAGLGSGGGFGGGDPAGLLDGVDGRAPGSSDGVVPVLPGEECAGEVFEGEALPLELLIMMDRSVSMGDDRPEYLLPNGGTKWDAVRVGFEDFFALPQVQILKAGIDYFSQSSCEAEDYSTPEVGIGPVSAQRGALLDSYDDHSPGGNTPISPALEGALMHAADWKLDHPGAHTAVVLVTDGVPNGCGTTTADPQGGAAIIAPIAESYATASPPIPTYVLGIQGIEVSAGDFRHVVTTIANAGGTEPVIVEADDDLAAKFAGALEGIREAAAPPCNYAVPLPPSGEQLDLARVNVVLVPEDSGPEPILNVPDADSCEHGGWYYDPPEDPESIRLCPNTCDVVSTLKGAGFRVVFGCGTVTVVH